MDSLRRGRKSHASSAASYDAYMDHSIADQALSQEILDLVQQSSHYRQLKKG